MTESNEAATQHREYSDTERQIMMSAMVVFIVVTLAGNSVMLWCITRIRALRTINNVFLASLCCCNLVNGCITMPLIAYSMMSNQTTLVKERAESLKWICTVSGFIDNGAMVGFMWTLTILSIDRFTLIRHPMWYKCKQSQSRAVATVVLIWVLALAIVTPPLFGTADYLYSEWTFSCGINPLSDSNTGGSKLTRHVSYFICFCVLNSAIPIPIVIISNVHILGVLLRTRTIRKQATIRRYRKSATLMIVLTAYFIISLGPVFIGSYIYIAMLVGPDTSYTSLSHNMPSMRILLASHVLFLGNGAVTPIFFGLFNSSIRNKYMLVLQSRRATLITSFQRKMPTGHTFRDPFLKMVPIWKRQQLKQESPGSSHDDMAHIKHKTTTNIPSSTEYQELDQHKTSITNTHIGCSPFNNQRFVFPESTTTQDGFESGLLHEWDSKCNHLEADETPV